MNLRVLSSLLLGCLLVMIAQGDSLSRVDQGQEGNKNKLEVTRITSMYAKKEPFERTGAVHMRKIGPGGKKLSTHEEMSMDSKNGKEADIGGAGTSKISGKEKDALPKSFGSLRDQKNDLQKHMTKGPKAWKFTSFTIRRSSLTNAKSSSKSKEPQGTAQEDETPSIVDAAKEIASLIYKDYKGKPSHKPPINNNEPRN